MHDLADENRENGRFVFLISMKNLEIRRRLIRSMRNRISYSVAVVVSPETFQNEVFFVLRTPLTLIGNCRGSGIPNKSDMGSAVSR